MDHSYSSEVTDEISQNNVPANNDPDDTDNVKIEEKHGDDYLIDLYRERRFLYDKRDKNFKDNEMKENAWLEISKIMKDKDCGMCYTAEYCQRRMKVLREKFSRLQKNEQNCKSGSAASTEKRSPLLNQMSFLIPYVKRRRTFSNVMDSKEEVGTIKENIDNAAIANNTGPKQQNIRERKTEVKAKETHCEKRKLDDENIFNVITTLTNSILSDSSNSSSNVRTAETVFAEYIALELQSMNEPERTIKKQKLMEVLNMSVGKM